MNSVIVLALLILTVSLSFPGDSAFGQTTSQGQGSPEQWTSHQMNQPPPEPTDKNNLSPDRVDDIADLYLMAKKEKEEAKTKKDKR